MELIGQKNINAHLRRPLTPENKKVTCWKPNPHFLHCCIESQGCRFSRNCGACIMCDYGIGRNLSPDEVTHSLEQELSKNLDSVTTVLFGTYGSIFDESEISAECFDAVLNYLCKIEIDTVIFETHCSTVNDLMLEKISNTLTNINHIIIEMGFESSNEFVLHKCLNKKLDLNSLINSIETIHRHNMSACLNVFVGSPFLSTKDQLTTSLESIHWAFNHKADSVVIFPANIKPFTLMYRLFEQGFYQPVSHWLVIELLSRLPQKYLERIAFSWFGDRKNFYEDNQYPLIPPTACDNCHDMIFEFYYSFMEEKTALKRKQKLDALMANKNICSCYSNLMNDIGASSISLNESEINSLIQHFG